MSDSSYDYENRKGIHPISWEMVHAICKGLAIAVSHFEPDLIVPIGRGGYYPGALLAHLLQVEVRPVHLSRRVRDKIKYDSPKWIAKVPNTVDRLRVTIVDEICDSGETLSMVREACLSKGAIAVTSAVLYAHTWGQSVPDYIGLVSDALILNPWDREVLKDENFQLHPEYANALVAQGLEPDDRFLIGVSATQIAKGQSIDAP